MLSPIKGNTHIRNKKGRKEKSKSGKNASRQEVVERYKNGK